MYITERYKTFDWAALPNAGPRPRVGSEKKTALPQALTGRRLVARRALVIELVGVDIHEFAHEVVRVGHYVAVLAEHFAH